MSTEPNIDVILKQPIARRPLCLTLGVNVLDVELQPAEIVARRTGTRLFVVVADRHEIATPLECGGAEKGARQTGEFGT